MKLVNFIFFLSAVCLTSACNKWPPADQELMSHFLEGYVAMERLTELLGESEYVGVHLDETGAVVGNYVETGKWTEGSVKTETPINDQEWQALFAAAGLRSITQRSKNEFVFNVKLIPGRKNRVIFVSFVRSDNFEFWGAACATSFRNLPCGKCTIQLEGKWRISYTWDPGGQSFFTPELSKLHSKGEISLDEYSKRAGEKADACYKSGREIIRNHST